MNFLTKLKSGLSKTSGKLGGGITGIFTKRKLDDAALEELEDLLIEADIGAATAAQITGELSAQRFDKEMTDEEVRSFLADQITAILSPYTTPLMLDESQKPTVVLVIGVNGNGKTTTIGKLAHRYKAEGKRVMLAAADTFRAAAVEQLQVWGQRCDIPVITGPHESDPASVAYQAYEKAKTDGVDVLLVDTAGRLHNKSNLMQELQKISNVLKKVDESAPHHVVQVLDATTGQNAVSQVSAFKEMIGVTGMVITKLDGTAKGGIVVALAKQFGLPIHAIGIGEAIEDLDSFEAKSFACNLVDL
ncbi:MAG: signal recognition particle-docking protein FtsY [Rickettsiales bacterium]